MIAAVVIIKQLLFFLYRKEIEMLKGERPHADSLFRESFVCGGTKDGFCRTKIRQKQTDRGIMTEEPHIYLLQVVPVSRYAEMTQSESV